MNPTGEISIRREGRAGRITLTRPKALNALTYAMATAIEAALVAWRNDPAISLVLIDAEGDKAFCAGGDIQDLYETGRAGDFAFGKKFWRDEYRLNAMIATYPKPYVALMQGFVMGGGVGISCHGSHRIVCENSRIAMPECGIGLIPDVGGSWLLAHAPGHLGEYLGLTGSRMNAADAILAGFADSFVPRENWPELARQLCATGDSGILAQFSTDPGTALLAQIASEVDAAFAGASAMQCLAHIEADSSPWAMETAKAIRRACPLSIACGFEIIRNARTAQSLVDVLAMEYRFTARCMEHGEFLEGIRAAVIDKDRNPQWQTPMLEDISGERIAFMLSDLGSDELNFREE
ncbi:MAG: enoyl-CoA hydratase/isomerase family protein [Nitratireductor sp.]